LDQREERVSSLLGPFVADGIARIAINRPEQRNALNGALRDELHTAAASLSSNPDVRVLVLSGEGKAFAAGADVAELEALDPEGGEALSLAIAEFHRSLRNAPFVSIAAVRGWCLGGGFELALACDIVVAAEDAQFALPEIRLGIIPGGGGLARLARAAGGATARFMALTGQMIDARRARDLGIVAEVFAPEGFDSGIDDLARRLARNSPAAVRAMKQALEVAGEDNLDTAIAREARIGGALYGTPDQRRLMRKFLDKS
jgi:enoyl-CoA hydratase